MNKQPKITRKTKDAIIHAFLSLYREKSIEKITVREITELSGFSRGTFYRHFQDVYEIRDEVEEHLIVPLREYLTSAENSLLAPESEKMKRFYREEKVYLEAVLGEYGSAHFMKSLREAVPVEHCIEPGICDESLISYLTDFRIATTLTLFQSWMRNGEDLDADRLISLIHDLYTGGFSACLKVAREDQKKIPEPNRSSLKDEERGSGNDA